ncbi:hypothetical protein, partial [Candidatus Parabeggiatoa sp. HSG14]|uniref:hypothetical protein n=1 Tax=Candidatus Parabeggiatoa sp. HSG14 TaxID=3055593 RepID=UPI0025A78739|nr:hypothetical protein [Thiotrichales bacterium HSG14]
NEFWGHLPFYPPNPPYTGGSPKIEKAKCRMMFGSTRVRGVRGGVPKICYNQRIFIDIEKGIYIVMTGFILSFPSFTWERTAQEAPLREKPKESLNLRKLQ